jgi:putative acetyltransferase
METLITERLVLRPFRKEDLDDFYEYAKNPSVGPNAGWKPHESKEESREILERFIAEEESWAIIHKDTDKLIGSIGLHNDARRNNSRVKMLGYVLDEAYWGQGIMTEAAKRVLKYAFENLDLNLVSVYHYPSNIRSKRVIEKCGFHYEGTLRRANELYDGSIHDSMCYSLTKEEYRG